MGEVAVAAVVAAAVQQAEVATLDGAPDSEAARIRFKPRTRTRKASVSHKCDLLLIQPAPFFNQGCTIFEQLSSGAVPRMELPAQMH